MLARPAVFWRGRRIETNCSRENLDFRGFDTLRKCIRSYSTTSTNKTVRWLVILLYTQAIVPEIFQGSK